MIPRPILQDLGITYRRVPVLSIGKDVFPDNTTFIDALQSLLEKSGKGLRKSREDRAFEQWGYVSSVLVDVKKGSGPCADVVHLPAKFLGSPALCSCKPDHASVGQGPRESISGVCERGFPCAASKWLDGDTVNADNS